MKNLCGILSVIMFLYGCSDTINTPGDLIRGEKLQEINRISLPQEASKMTSYGNYIYIASDDKINIIDISKPANPHLIGSFTHPARIRNLSISFPCLYIGDYSYIDIYDITQPTSLVHKDSLRVIGYKRLVSRDSLIYLLDYTQTLMIIKVNNFLFEVLAEYKLVLDNLYEKYDKEKKILDLTLYLKDNYLYICGMENFLQIDITNPFNIKKQLLGIKNRKPQSDIVIKKDHLYFIEELPPDMYLTGLKIDSFNEVLSFRIETSYNDKTVIYSQDKYIYILNETGLQVIDISDLKTVYEAGYSETPGVDFLLKSGYIYVISDNNLITYKAL